MSVELSALVNPIKIGDVSGGTYIQINIDGTVEYLNLNTGYIPTGSEPTGTLYWCADEGSLALKLSDDVIYNFGEEIYLPVVSNQTGLLITNGTIVLISGALSEKPTVAPVDGTSVASAHATIAMATEAIANNGTGRCTREGVVRGLDTDAYAEGDELFLDPTSTTGEFTDTEPSGDDSYVSVGYVLKSSATDGWLWFSVRHVEALAELADVVITTPADGDTLKYDASTMEWKNFTTGAEFTAEGGLAIRLTNKTGAASVKGSSVDTSNTFDNAFELQSIELDCIGVVYEDGVADGSECLVVVSGIAQVLLEDGTASTRGYWVKASAVDGRADATNPAPLGGSFATVEDHFKEMGHCIETKTAGTDVLARCVLQQN